MAKKTSPPAKPASAAAVKAPVRHPIKAATLLYSAPGFVLRGPIYLTFVSMIAMLAYSFVATTDTLVAAPLVLQRRTVTVQAISGGIIESLDVSENSTVTIGQPLATIQEKIQAASTPEQEALDRQRREYQERRDALLRDYDHRRRQTQSQRDDLSRRLTTGAGAMQDRLGQLENQLRTAERTRANIQEDQRTAEANLARLQPLCAHRDIPITQCEGAQQRVSDLKRAVSNAQADIDNIKLSLATTRRELGQQSDEQSLARLDADLAKMQVDFDQQVKQIDERIADIERRREEVQTLVPGVRHAGDKAFYTGLVEGVVTTVHVQRGQLINPGASLVTIVQNSAPLEARVLIFNKDIGHLKVGQDVKIKYFAYPYQEYGIQSGTISEISVRPSSAAGESGMFVVNVALAAENIRRQGNVGDTTVKMLEIGLTGVAEIKTGERRFIEMLFAPASKFFQGGGEGGGPAPAGEGAPAAGGAAGANAERKS